MMKLTENEKRHRTKNQNTITGNQKHRINNNSTSQGKEKGLESQRQGRYPLRDSCAAAVGHARIQSDARLLGCASAPDPGKIRETSLSDGG